MDYTFEESDEEQLDIEDDLEMLREDLVGELQAINQYQEHIESLENEEAVTTLEHIIEEEKEHVAELLRLIQNLDPVQAEKFKGEIS
jgi:rubrerythrin